MKEKKRIVSERHERGADSKFTDAPLFDDEGVYEIKVKGHLAAHWAESLGNLPLSYDDEGNTLLSETIVDQAALHGILAQIRNLGLSLLSLTRVEGTD